MKIMIINYAKCILSYNHFWWDFFTMCVMMGVYLRRNTQYNSVYVVYIIAWPWPCSGFPNGSIGNLSNGTIGSQWFHWLNNGTNGTEGRARYTIGRTLNGLLLVALVEPWAHALCSYAGMKCLDSY